MLLPQRCTSEGVVMLIPHGAAPVSGAQKSVGGTVGVDHHSGTGLINIAHTPANYRAQPCRLTTDCDPDALKVRFVRVNLAFVR